MRKTGAIAFCLFWLLGFCGSIAAAADRSEVALPITLDYPLLTALVAATAYPRPDTTAVLVDENDHCTHLALSHPRLSEEGGRVRFETRVSLKVGTFFSGECALPISWEGHLVFFQKPVVDTRSWALSFTTEDSALFGMDGRPAQIAGVLWDLIKGWVYAYIDGIRVDLAPPVADLKTFLLPLFPDTRQEEARRVIDSMRPGAIEILPAALVISVLVDTDAPAAPEPAFREDAAGLEAPLGEAERERFIERWESFDVLLVQMVTLLAGKPLKDEQRQELMDVLLEVRYGFSEALAATVPGRDGVREAFLSAWKRLSPIFREHLTGGGRTALGYLSFFTASDALAALDRLGPALGIEVSREGLVRMARMLSGSEETTLEYLPDVNPELRRMMGLDPLPEPEGELPEVEGDELPFEEDSPDAPPSGAPLPMEDPEAGLWRLFFPSAWAAQTPSFARIRQWAPPKTGIDAYVNRVRAVLKQSAAPVLSSGKIPSAYRGAFRQMIPAMAWQESCFRQFVPKRGKLTFLRSHNGTSVGLMQIHERVWRGVYDLGRLRWDIAYNARAGCEIAALYVEKYALSKWKSRRPMDGGVLARIVYAMYNGGPGQHDKFLSRMRSGRYYASDTLFLEKLEWVKTDQWKRVRNCLGRS